MTGRGAAPGGEIEARVAAAAAFVRAAGARARQGDAVDLSGLEDCVGAIYDGVKAVSGAGCGKLIEALVDLQRDLDALAELLSARHRPLPPTAAATIDDD